MGHVNEILGATPALAGTIEHSADPRQARETLSFPLISQLRAKRLAFRQVQPRQLHYKRGGPLGAAIAGYSSESRRKKSIANSLMMN